MQNDVELMTLFWTTAGIYPGEGEISPFAFRDRVEAAARAGFKGIGIWHTDLEHIRIHHSLAEMKAILNDNDIRYVELEFLTDWFLDGARKSESDGRKRRLLEASAALGAKHVKVGDFYSSYTPMPRLVEAFAALCKEAEEYGATIAFEFMASAMLTNLPDSLAMVEGAGAKNGGLVLDIVHVVNLGIPYAEIARLPRQAVVSVELNDGGLLGSPRHDPTGARLLCGEGEYDIQGFIEAVRQTGFTGPWAVEVFARDLAKLPLKEQNQRAFETTMAQFRA